MNGSDIDNREVSRALIHATADTLRSALKDKLREKVMTATDDFSGAFIDPDASVLEDPDAFEEARARWRRGDKREALHQLENALGRDFSGLGDLRPEDLK